MKLQALMEQLAQRLQLGAVEPDEQGHFQLTFDDLDVVLFANGQTLYLEGEVGPLAADQRERVEQSRRLLQLALVKAAEQQAVLALDEEQQRLVLFQTLQLDQLDVRRFELLLEHFLNDLEFWVQNQQPMAAAPLGPPLNMMFP